MLGSGHGGEDYIALLPPREDPTARSGGRLDQRLAAVPPPCHALERAVLVPALRAGVQAQARARWWVGPGTDMVKVPCLVLIIE